MLRRRHLPAIAAGLLAAPALAQAPWPARPIRLVVPYPPGGASDIAGRLQAQALAEGLGVQVVVDNRAGAGGTIGTAHVAQSAPDGYTVMMASPSSHLGAPLLFKTPGYEGVEDFTCIATFATGTAMVCVNNALPVTNIQELVAHAKANPGKLNYGSAGAGGANHMLGVLFMQRTGTELTHVPYRGAAPALADLIAGNIQVVFDSYSGVIGAVRAGQIRALAVTNPTRWPLAPEFPTVQEQGVPNYDLPSFSAVMGPKGIPEPIVARMNAAINEGLKKPQMIERLAANGNAPYPSTPEAFLALMRTQRALWQELVRSTGLQPE
ncbi:Bug family tripartite tricarboxylate transporter substrate binding protein [Falsiroseomonas tokyonensis]|uniref:Bug family tripartite tricarboxylate transporter substrate binding protein n=1 Tax=Falsiroseomonas tokyonensis TaxID=430521 RepID=A0ABV7BRD1_9PROT|nr:tripartite tricarboxylate transporter substrate binding protein [Falsiroseomonas tokyonensis]MBU8538178.1 tripartite tricarboxylate transporter substrate binding protein [Falsiroseomonas tokyonensis]